MGSKSLCSSAASSAFIFDLPAELLLYMVQGLHDQLSTDLGGVTACRTLIPLTLVCCKWHELIRPLTYSHISITPSRAHKLATTLNTPRRWARYITHLRIDLGLHFASQYAPIVISVIASCQALESLCLAGCGKPVYKTFVLQAESVLYAQPLRLVFAKLRHLDVSGPRKAASTGLDAAKVLAWILPLCPNLQSLARGWWSYKSDEVATLQPIPFLLSATAPGNSTINTSSPLQRIPAPLLMHNLAVMTLSSRHLGARAFAQAMDLCVPGILQELVIHCHEAPQKRYFLDVFEQFGPGLRSLRMLVPFSSHRLYQLLDVVVGQYCQNLETLVLVGPLCSDDMLENLAVSNPRLRHVEFAHNKAITPEAIEALVTNADWSTASRKLVLTDMLASAWDAEWVQHFGRPLSNSRWTVKIAKYDWFEFWPQRLAQDLQAFSADIEGGARCHADNTMLRYAWYDADYVPGLPFASADAVTDESQTWSDGSEDYEDDWSAELDLSADANPPIVSAPQYIPYLAMEADSSPRMDWSAGYIARQQSLS